MIILKINHIKFMKKFFITNIVFLMFLCNAYTQVASDYFPTDLGHKWYYKVTSLDSNNTPIPNSTTYTIDSFAITQTYQNLLANIVLEKNNLTSINQNSPYTDSLFYNFQSSNAFAFFNLSMIPDTLPIGGYIDFIKSFETWYNTYRFAQIVNSSYTIFTKDTTLNISGTNLALRFSYKGKRLNDETIQTVNGSYLTKKFVMTLGIGYLPFPIVEIPIYQRPDTIWFAQNVWKVKESVPTTGIDLSSIGYPIAINFPGSITELSSSTSIRNISSEVPSSFNLYQNYPNPFNPTTKIKFDVARPSFVNLTVFDITGKEISNLVNERLSAGTYEYNFDGSALSSGIYMYRIDVDNLKFTKSMILIK